MYCERWKAFLPKVLVAPPDSDDDDDNNGSGRVSAIDERMSGEMNGENGSSLRQQNSLVFHFHGQAAVPAQSVCFDA